MQFTRDDYKDNLYHTSISDEDRQNVLLKCSEQNIDVYNIDWVKDWFCQKYRSNSKLRSCDAYYCGNNNKLVMEFKNANHLKLKAYMEEIVEKIVDTHMLLMETFFQTKKVTYIATNLKLLVVFNDEKNCEAGVQSIKNYLNTVTPKKGDQTRNVNNIKCYTNEEEFREAIQNIKSKFCPDFYAELDFIDKKDFYEVYIKPGNYFANLD